MGNTSQFGSNAKLEVITPPASEPVSLDEAKLHLKVNYTDDDALINSLIVAARTYCEGYTRRAFITTTYEQTFDWFNSWGSWASVVPPGGVLPRNRSYVNQCLQLFRPKLQEVNSIKYVDTSDNLVTIDPSKYRVVTGTPGQVQPAYGSVWPTTSPVIGAIIVNYTAGYGDDATSVPETIKAAMKLLISHWYESRSAVVLGTIATEVPFAVDSLLASECWS